MAVIEYAADADGGLKHSIAYRTDVMVAYDGTEQRVSLAARDRSAYEGTFILPDADMRATRSLLSRLPAGLHELALRHESMPARHAVTSTSVEIDATYVDWAVVGRRVLIEGPAGDRYAAEIDGVSGSTIKTLTLDTSPPSGSFPAGSTFVIPLEPVRLEDGQGLGRYPVHLGRWGIQARATGYLDTVGTGATIATHDSLPVLDRRPLNPGLAQEQVMGGIEFLDAGAAFTSATGWTRSKIRRSHEWTVDSPAARQWWKLFLRTVRGRFSPFLLATWLDDQELTEQPSGGATQLRVRPGYVDDWWPSLAHRRLQLECADGSVLYRNITAASEQVGYDALTIAALPGTIPGGSIARVSFLETCRLDSDQHAIEYRGARAGRIAAAAVVVQEEAPAVMT